MVEFARQTHFLHLVPPDLLMWSKSDLPIYPMFNVISDNFLDALDFIGSKYIPKYGGLDYGDFFDAKEWIRKSSQNTIRFSEAGYEGHSGFAFLPKNVQKYHSRIMLQMDLWSQFNDNPEILGNPVMYRPGSQNWKNDILVSTYHLWYRLRTYPYEIKRVDMDQISSSRILRLVHKLYNNLLDNDEREIASDVLVSTLFRGYFTHIANRLRRNQSY